MLDISSLLVGVYICMYLFHHRKKDIKITNKYRNKNVNNEKNYNN